MEIQVCPAQILPNNFHSKRKNKVINLDIKIYGESPKKKRLNFQWLNLTDIQLIETKFNTLNLRLQTFWVSSKFWAIIRIFT